MGDEQLKSSTSLTGQHGEREYDLIIWGATGYTGRLALNYLASKDGADTLSGRHFRWAIAGRDQKKLQHLAETARKKYSLEHPIQTLTASLENTSSLYHLASRTKTICAFVGPFTIMGEPMLEACIKMDTHYVDATAEVFWVQRMEKLYHDEAVKRRIKIVSYSGFDFVPNDLMMLQMLPTLKKNVPEWTPHYPLIVNHLFEQSTPWVSGGTAQSGMYLVGSFPLSKAVEAYTDPYIICPDALSSIPEETQHKNTYFILPSYVELARAYITPFVMSSLMSKFIHWSNYSQNFQWGTKLHYRGGEVHHSVFVAYWFSIVIWIQYTCLLILRRFPFLSKLLVQPGDGPAINPETAYMKSTLVAQPFQSLDRPSQTSIVVRWSARGIEPYTFAAISLVESALAIALQDTKLPETVGYLPPSAALGQALIDRLKLAGLEQTVTVESSPIDKSIAEHKNIA